MSDSRFIQPAILALRRAHGGEPLDISADYSVIYSGGRIGDTAAMNSSENAHAAVAAEPPCLPLVEVEGAVRRQFGLDGVYVPLVSERDQNFRLETPSGPEYVVKITSAAEPAIVTAFHIAALMHLEHIAAPRVPAVVRTVDGQDSADIEYAGSTHKLRVVSYIAGVPLANVQMDPERVRDLGAALARLDIGLQDFSHAGERPRLLWDLQRASELRELLGYISDAGVRVAVTAALKDFEDFVLPELDHLRSQVIHGDANPGNILLDPHSYRVTGVIDFGDAVRAPLVFNVAIAAAYLRSTGADPLELIAPFIDAYHAENPLEQAEVVLLFDLVRARLATTITLLFWRLGARHDQDAYRQKTLDEEADAVRFLEALDAIGRDRFAEKLARATQR